MLTKRMSSAAASKPETQIHLALRAVTQSFHSAVSGKGGLAFARLHVSYSFQSWVSYGHFTISMHHAGGSRSRKAFSRCSRVMQRGTVFIASSMSSCLVGGICQRRAVPSSVAVTTRRPSGLNAALNTLSPWRSSAMSLPVSTSQRHVVSCPPLGSGVGSVRLNAGLWKWRSRLQHEPPVEVRFGSIASIFACPRRVRFAPVSDQRADVLGSPVGAKRGPFFSSYVVSYIDRPNGVSLFFTKRLARKLLRKVAFCLVSPTEQASLHQLDECKIEPVGVLSAQLPI